MRRISVVVPAKDEQDSIAALFERILVAVDEIPDASLEIIFVDDGSVDGTWAVMRALADEYKGIVRAFRLRRNFGKAAALEIGFRASTGDIIITMDADLQDDPKEIERFLDKIDSGFDLVSGWKQKRNDPLSKTVPSRLFNAVTSWMSGVKLRDFNCGFKAYRREVVESVRIYGELHRYVPVLAQDAGFRVGEIPVEHHARKFGVTKYGIERYVRGFLDLITILAITRYLQRPSHLFGGLGVLFGVAGFAILSVLTALWFYGQPIGGRPLFFLGFLFMILSVQMISMGVIAELLIHLSSPKDAFRAVAENIGGDHMRK